MQRESPSYSVLLVGDQRMRYVLRSRPSWLLSIMMDTDMTEDEAGSSPPQLSPRRPPGT